MTAGGLLAYLTGTSLVNPHLSLRYKMPGSADEPTEWVNVPRVSDTIPATSMACWGGKCAPPCGDIRKITDFQQTAIRMWKRSPS